MSSAELFEGILALMDKLYEDGEMRYAAYDSLWNALETYVAKCAEESEKRSTTYDYLRDALEKAYAAKRAEECADKEQKQLDANTIQKFADSLRTSVDSIWQMKPAICQIKKMAPSCEGAFLLPK